MFSVWGFWKYDVRGVSDAEFYRKLKVILYFCSCTSKQVGGRALGVLVWVLGRVMYVCMYVCIYICGYINIYIYIDLYTCSINTNR